MYPCWRDRYYLADTSLFIMKMLLLQCLLLGCIGGYGQLTELKPAAEWQTIAEVKVLTASKAKLAYLPGTDSVYLLTLKDEKVLKNSRDMAVVNYYHVRFNGEHDTLFNLYLLLKSFFLPANQKDKNYQKTFALGTTTVQVQHFNNLTGKNIMFVTKDGYTMFSEREIDKLFGSK